MRVSPIAILQYGVLTALLVMTFGVFVVMVLLSLRPSIAIYLDFWSPPWPPSFANYRGALRDLIPSALRTLGIAAVSIAGTLCIGCIAAYAFARMRFPGKEILFYALLAVMMIPGVILLTPHFIIAADLNLRGSLTGLCLYYIAGGLPFATFLITTFFRSQPSEIFDASRIDGATEVQSLLRIAVPLALPILVTVAIMNFLSIYSDFIWPSLMLPPGKQTLMLALERYNPQTSQFTSRPDLGMQTAGYVIATVPQLVIFALGMKYFIEGVTSGSVKA